LTRPRPTLRNVALEMRDGITLAANVYLPADASPAPAVVVYVPYLKDGWQGLRSAGYLEYFATCGYAAVNVDFRGTGASEGVKADAFEPVESDDVHDVIEQIAGQPWCDGNVGIWGVSYGGITALRAAAARPPHLRAVVAVEGSTDPYEYEVMRCGVPGLGSIIGEWASLMLGLAALPPLWGTPNRNEASIVAAHISGLAPWHFAWRDHPLRDSYWQGREVDPAAIEVPTMIITSWRDTNILGAWRDYSALRGPRRILSGPWQHGMPDAAATDPINSTKEMVRWFDTWLRGEDRGLAGEAPVHLYVLGTRRWESHEEWPPPTRVRKLYATVDGRLGEEPSATVDRIPIRFDATVGLQAGLGVAHAPRDQARDDALSVTFDTAPFSEPLEIVMQAEVTIPLAFTEPDTDIAVRIADVSPDGASSLITKGFVRLSNPPRYVGASVPPGTATVTVACNPCRYHLAAGHRLRLAVAGADFPEVWPVRAVADYDVVVGGAEGIQLTIHELLHPAEATQGFTPADPGLASPYVKSSETRLVLAPPDSEGRAVARGHRDDSLVAIDGESVELRHMFEASTFARRPELTQLVTETRASVQQPHRLVAVMATTYSSNDIATARVVVCVDGAVAYTRSFEHSPATIRPGSRLRCRGRGSSPESPRPPGP
jgi:uncharacterized protein